MNEFPQFMRNPLNKISSNSQFTPGIEGYVFDGADGSQMAFWTYKQDAKQGVPKWGGESIMSHMEFDI